MPAALCDQCYARLMRDDEFVRSAEEDERLGDEWEAARHKAAVEQVMREKGFKTEAEARAYMWAVWEYQYGPVAWARAAEARATHEQEWRELGTKGETGSDRDG